MLSDEKTPAKVTFKHDICEDDKQMFALFGLFGTRRLSSKKPVIKVMNYNLNVLN